MLKRIGNEVRAAELSGFPRRFVATFFGRSDPRLDLRNNFPAAFAGLVREFLAFLVEIPTAFQCVASASRQCVASLKGSAFDQVPCLTTRLGSKQQRNRRAQRCSG